MKKAISPELLKKYLRGEATPEESSSVDAWYQSLQENPDDVSLLDPLELDIVQNRILGKVKANIEVPAQADGARTTSFNFLRTPCRFSLPH